MKNSKKTACILFATALISSGVAEAKDFANRTELREKSSREGVGKETSLVLKRIEARGEQQTLSLALSTLEKSGIVSNSRVHRTETGHRKTTYIGDNWHVSVYGEGDKLKFRKGRMSASPKENDERRALRVAVADRKKNQELEVLGRRIVDGLISNIVDFSKNDEIVPIYTLHLVEGSKSKDGVSSETYVSGSTIVFGRRIDGVSVVGAGSKIAVMFDNNGNLEGFDVQWSKFEPSFNQIENLSGSMQRERINALLSKNKGKVEIESVECGYVDFGFMRRIKVSDHMQTGCQVTYQIGEEEMRPNLMYVPAAANPVLTKGFWPELNEIAEKGDVCTQKQFSF